MFDVQIEKFPYQLNGDFSVSKKDGSPFKVKKGKYRAKALNAYDCECFIEKRRWFFKDYTVKIRFEDNLSVKGVNEIIAALTEEYGEPKWFSSWYGFIWKTENSFVSFGYVSIEYKYAVPMLTIYRSTFFDNKIEYTQYKKVSDVFNVFFNRHELIDAYATPYIPWNKDTGFFVVKKSGFDEYGFNLKNNKLTAFHNEVIPMPKEERPEDFKEFKINNTIRIVPKNRVEKDINSYDELESVLEEAFKSL